MKLYQLINVFVDSTPVRVATENGQKWIADTTAEVLPITINEKYLSRKVIEVYHSEGREYTSTCCVLKPALCIIVEGYENGTI